MVVVPLKLVPPPDATPSNIGSTVRGYFLTATLRSNVHVNARDSFKILISSPA